MMTSSNGNIFRVTDHLCEEFTGPGEFHAQRPVTRSFDVFFYLRLNKRLSKQSRGWWFETLSRPLWRHRNVKSDATPHHRCWGLIPQTSNTVYQNIQYSLHPRKKWKFRKLTIRSETPINFSSKCFNWIHIIHLIKVWANVTARTWQLETHYHWTWSLISVRFHQARYILIDV